jgi:hypothetical protein
LQELIWLIMSVGRILNAMRSVNADGAGEKHHHPDSTEDRRELIDPSRYFLDQLSLKLIPISKWSGYVSARFAYLPLYHLNPIHIQFFGWFRSLRF